MSTTLSEEVVISILLNEPALTQYTELKPANFLNKRNRAIYEELLSQCEYPDCDYTTISRELESNGYTEYITRLFNDYHNGTTLKFHVKRILEDYNKAKVRFIGSKMLSGEGNPLAILAEAEEELSECTKSATLYRDNKTILKGTMVTLEKRMLSKDGVVGDRLYFKKLDGILGGGHNGRLWLLGGRPGQGKSALAGNIVERKAIERNEPCCVLSFEMGDETWMERFLMSIANVRPNENKNCFGFDKIDYQNITQAAEKIVNAPIYILEYAGKTIEDVCMTIKLMHKKHGVKFFVIDYVQLIGGKGTEYERVTETSIKLTALKQKLKINILALAQLNRSSEAGGKKRKPVEADLRNSGQLEQDADAVMFVHRDDENDWILVPKNRHGKTGDIPAKFTGRTFKWEEKVDV